MRHATSLRRPPAPPSKRDAAIFNRATSRQRPPSPTWPCGPPPRGGEASDRMRAYGGANGRGNLRENREDPAPTVGRLRGFHCASHCDPNVAHGRRHARTMPPRAPPTYGDPMVFTTTRHLIATRRATSLQTPFPHMRMRAPAPPYARTMPPASPHEPVVLKRRGTPRRYGLRIIASA